MATLQELVMGDGIFGGSEKVASVAQDQGDEASISKIAAELGLFGSDAAPAASHEEAGESVEKLASSGSFEGLYASMFPGDELGGATKVASEEEKVAAAEEALGARTWDHFAARFDARIEKLAYEALKGSAHKSDVEAPNHMPNNKVHSAGAIDTTPHVTDSVKDTSPEGGVGKYEQKHVKAAALRKQMLLGMLEG
jgi:hypothetical protein